MQNLTKNEQFLANFLIFKENFDIFSENFDIFKENFAHRKQNLMKILKIIHFRKFVKGGLG